MPDISRRSVALGAAWSLPAVTLASALPAFAASVCTPALQTAIDAQFTSYRTRLATYLASCSTGNTDFVIWYDGAGGLNGYLQNSQVNVRNATGCDIDTLSWPLRYRLDIQNLTGPSGVKRSLLTSSAYFNYAQIGKPGVVVDGGTNRDHWTFTNADGSLAATANTGYYSLTLWQTDTSNTVFNVGEDADFGIQWEDGGTSNGRLTNQVRLVPLGFAPPTWDAVRSATGADDVCHSYYAQRVALWDKNGEGCLGINWYQATNVTAASHKTTSGWTKTPISCGTGMWSTAAKDFTPGHDGIY